MESEMMTTFKHQRELKWKKEKKFDGKNIPNVLSLMKLFHYFLKLLLFLSFSRTPSISLKYLNSFQFIFLFLLLLMKIFSLSLTSFHFHFMFISDCLLYRLYVCTKNEKVQVLHIWKKMIRTSTLIEFLILFTRLFKIIFFYC